MIRSDTLFLKPFPVMKSCCAHFRAGDECFSLVVSGRVAWPGWEWKLYARTLFKIPRLSVDVTIPCMAHAESERERQTDTGIHGPAHTHTGWRTHTRAGDVHGCYCHLRWLVPPGGGRSPRRRRFAWTGEGGAARYPD